jgi:1-acyl-sn-glycerol-3-phosphate acyltransferase
MGTDTKFIGKKSLFKPPFGAVFRALGGYPVDRSKNNNFVDAVVEIFDSKEKFSIALAPEGTRKKVDKIKTGFYYIAKGANIPIILVRFDYANKEVTFSDPFYTTDNKEADLKFIDDHFRGTLGKIPENSYLYGT